MGRDQGTQSTICFVCISLRGGGTERVIAMVANELCARFQVAIVILGHEEPFYRLDSRVKILKFRPKSAFASRVQFYLALFGHVRDGVRLTRADVVFSFGELISPFVRLATLGLNVPLYIFNRESPYRSLRGAAGVLRPLLYPFAEGVVVQTQQAKHLLGSRYKFSRFHVIPNPVDTPAEVISWEDRDKTIINVGYLGGEKNQAALIRIFSRLEGARDWRLKFVGDGPDRSELERLGMDLGLEDRIEFLGERKDTRELMQSSRVFAFTSMSEGFPNVLAEAMANGCACISFDCATGPSDLIRNAQSGVLVPVADELAYLKGLDRLVHDNEFSRRLGRTAREEVRRLDKSHVIGMLEELLPETHGTAKG